MVRPQRTKEGLTASHYYREKHMSLIHFDYSNALIPQYGITQEGLDRLEEGLSASRQEVLDDVQLFHSGSTPAEYKQPLDAGFTDLPQRLLKEYRAAQEDSELGQILSRTKELADKVDRVVVLGIGGSYMGAKALMESCCQPFFNERSRGERGGYPRIYFEGNNVDNDASAGLLDLLGNGNPVAKEERWGLVVISKSGGTLETAAAFRQFFRALKGSLGEDAEQVADYVIPITGQTGKLFDLAAALGCDRPFSVPDGVGGRFSILSAVGLVPAALMGLDVVKLLEGAVAITDHFAKAEPKDNSILHYVGVMHLLEQWRGVHTRVLSMWSKALESAGLWYDQLLAESLGKDLRGALPLTVVNTRDLHSRAQQHQEGRRDKVYANVIVDQWRYAPVPIGKSEHNQDQLNELADKTLPDIMSAAIAGTNQAYLEDQRPTVDLHLPKVDEYTLGQFFQFMMLATVVEGRLLAMNPYGQPGVEAYKKNMNRILREK